MSFAIREKFLTITCDGKAFDLESLGSNWLPRFVSKLCRYAYRVNNDRRGLLPRLNTGGWKITYDFLIVSL